MEQKSNKSIICWWNQLIVLYMGVSDTFDDMVSKKNKGRGTVMLSQIDELKSVKIVNDLIKEVHYFELAIR